MHCFRQLEYNILKIITSIYVSSMYYCVCQKFDIELESQTNHISFPGACGTKGNISVTHLVLKYYK